MRQKSKSNSPPKRWSEENPKFRRSEIAKALELRADGLKVKEVGRRLKMHYTYVTRLCRSVANEDLSRQLESERAKAASIRLLQQEKRKLETRLKKVNEALCRLTVPQEPTATA